MVLTINSTFRHNGVNQRRMSDGRDRASCHRSFRRSIACHRSIPLTHPWFSRIKTVAKIRASAVKCQFQPADVGRYFTRVFHGTGFTIAMRGRMMRTPLWKRHKKRYISSLRM
ncbi:MAG: hypothetical protein AAFV88_06670 [Planctomycetota bacterium]